MVIIYEDGSWATNSLENEAYSGSKAKAPGLVRASDKPAGKEDTILFAQKGTMGTRPCSALHTA